MPFSRTLRYAKKIILGGKFRPRPQTSLRNTDNNHMPPAVIFSQALILGKIAILGQPPL